MTEKEFLHEVSNLAGTKLISRQDLTIIKNACLSKTIPDNEARIIGKNLKKCVDEGTCFKSVLDYFNNYIVPYSDKINDSITPSSTKLSNDRKIPYKEGIHNVAKEQCPKNPNPNNIRKLPRWPIYSLIILNVIVFILFLMQIPSKDLIVIGDDTIKVQRTVNISLAVLQMIFILYLLIVVCFDAQILRRFSNIFSNIICVSFIVFYYSYYNMKIIPAGVIECYDAFISISTIFTIIFIFLNKLRLLGYIAHIFTIISCLCLVSLNFNYIGFNIGNNTMLIIAAVSAINFFDYIENGAPQNL